VANGVGDNGSGGGTSLISWLGLGNPCLPANADFVPWEQPPKKILATPFTLLYPKLELAAPNNIKLPTSYLGAWSIVNGTFGGSNAKLLDATGSASSQQNSSIAGIIPAGSNRLAGLGQFLSPALKGQTVSAGNWTVEFAGNSSSGFITWSGYVAVYLVNGSTGLIRTTIVPLGSVALANRTGTNSELTVYSLSVSGSSFTVSAGDYLAVELGISATNTDVDFNHGSTSNIYTSGNTDINADNIVIADAKTLIICPASLQFLGGDTFPAIPRLIPRLDYIDPPNFWAEYAAYRVFPAVQWYAPAVPPLNKLSQRIDPPIHFNDQWFRQEKVWPIPASYIPSSIMVPPPGKYIVTLPDLWQEWEAYTELPYVQWFVPAKPATKQASQRWDALPDYVFTSFEQSKRWPTPVQYIPTPDPPPLRQRSQQLYFDLPDFNSIWFEQVAFFPRRQPLPSSFTTSQEGVYGIGVTIIMSAQAGDFRIQNNIEGYNVYIGSGSLPDLTQPPTTFSPSLPISVTLTPPVSGTESFYILVTKQDTYGLNSQNQYFTVITLDSSGNQVLPSIAIPQDLTLTNIADNKIRVMASYPTVSSDQYPANKWKVWAGLTPPDISSDTPVAIVNVNGKILAINIGPYSAGDLVYVVVALFRTTDSALSPVTSGTITIASPPSTVIAVPSGWEQLPDQSPI